MHSIVAYAPNCDLDVLSKRIMKCGIILLGLFLVGCSSVHTPPEPATHWVRSDDFGEYNGLYIFSQATDGRLWLTRYPEKHPTKAQRPEHVGFWSETNGVLNWFDRDKKNPIVFNLNTNGVFVEQDGKYYVPVELMAVPVIDGKPQFDE